MAQRLVRTLCNNCAEPHEPVDEIKTLVEKLLPGGAHQPAKWRQPVGCHACHGTGFRGRTGIHEMIPVTPEIQQLIVRGAASGQIEEAARNGGFRSLREDGFVKAYDGITSVEEVLRVTSG